MEPKQSWFDSQAHGWDKPSHIDMAQKAVEALCNHVTITEGTHVLEIGSGTGICSKMLVDRGASVVGVDTSEGKMLRGLYKITLIQIESS